MKKILHKITDGKETKYCNKCKMYLPLDSFNKNNTRWDGLYTICKYCRRDKPSFYYSLSVEQKKLYNILLKSEEDRTDKENVFYKKIINKE